MLTGQVLIDKLEAFSGTLPIAGLDILNEAGTYLMQMHRWNFARRRAEYLDLRGSITLSAATWSETTLELSQTGAFTNYTYLVGDTVQITGGTGATVGWYKIASRTDDDTIVLEESIGAGANGQTDIAGTMKLNSVRLPDHFAEILPPNNAKGNISESVAQPFALVSLEEILAMRSFDDAPSDSMYYGAISSASTSLIPPTPILEIHPPPHTTIKGGLMVFVRLGWKRLTDDQEVIQIPEHIEGLYTEICLAVLDGYGKREKGSVRDRVSRVAASTGVEGGMTTFMMAKIADGAQQPFIGPLRNGSMALGGRSDRSRFWFTNTPLPPS